MWSVRSLKRQFLQGKTTPAFHGIWTQDPLHSWYTCLSTEPSGTQGNMNLLEIHILNVKCEVIKETVSARKDQSSLPWDLNPRPLTLIVHMLIHWAISDTRIHELVENTCIGYFIQNTHTNPFGNFSQNNTNRGVLIFLGKKIPKGLVWCFWLKFP